MSNPDRLVKHNIEDANLDTCVDNLKKLPLHRYYYTDIYRERKKDAHQIGMLSDEVQKVFPNSVFDMPFKVAHYETIQNINYEQIYITHIGATKKLLQKVEEQQSTIQALQETIQSLVEKVTSLTTTS